MAAQANKTETSKNTTNDKKKQWPIVGCKDAFRYLEPFRRGSRVWRTDKQTDRQTDRRTEL